MAIFGQNPADVSGALFKSKNLLDVPDKTAARNNLNVPSKDDVLYNAVPIGMIMPYWGSTAPAGYLPCSGQTVTSGSFPDLVTFLGGTTSAVVPDLRGEFLRGWDNGRGVDTGRSIFSSQTDTLQNATGWIASRTSTAASTAGGIFSSNGVFNTTIQTSGVNAVAITTSGSPVASDSTTFDLSRVVRTSGETRPRNVSVLYCIKAYNCIQNYTSSFNVAGLVSDYSTLSAAAVKYSDWTGTNVQKASQGFMKFTNGVVMQWGSSATSNVTVSFPMSFPTAVTSIAITTSSTGFGTVTEVVSERTLSTFKINGYTSSATPSAAIASSWIALGY